jgi:hypothetical protein
MSSNPAESGPENSSENLHECPNVECGVSMAYITDESLTGYGDLEEVSLSCDNCGHEWTRYWEIETVSSFKKNQALGPLREPEITRLRAIDDEMFSEALRAEIFGPEDLDAAA